MAETFLFSGRWCLQMTVGWVLFPILNCKQIQTDESSVNFLGIHQTGSGHMMWDPDLVQRLEMNGCLELSRAGEEILVSYLCHCYMGWIWHPWQKAGLWLALGLKGMEISWEEELRQGSQADGSTPRSRVQSPMVVQLCMVRDRELYMCVYTLCVPHSVWLSVSLSFLSS